LSIICELISSCGIICRKNEPMSEHTTFKIGGPADVFIEPRNEEEAAKAVSICRENNIPISIIGNGSNLLVSDDGIEGAVICFGHRFSEITVDGCEIYAESGALLSHVCIAAGDNDLEGLEFAFGIPGAVGGAVFMNAGAYDGEVKDVITSIRVLEADGTISEVPASEAGFSYRMSRFQSEPERVILGAKFSLKKGDGEAIREKMREISHKRKSKQPLEYPSAGSAFKRPEGYFAAALIDSCGLKGVSVGGAQVSEKHAGFIINRGGATASDVLGLVELVKERVYAEKKVILTPEIRKLGR